MGLPEQVGYVNARLRARKSRLLGQPLLLALGEAASVEEMIERLRRTRYGAQLSVASFRETRPLVALDLAVGRTLEEDLAAIRRFTPDLAATPAAYLFRWWDLRNLKVVLRGVQGRRAPEEIEGACYAVGWVPMALWRELAASRTLEAAVDRGVVLDVPGRDELTEAWPEDAARGSLSPLEVALDRGLAARTLGQLSELTDPFWSPVEELVRFDLDVRNVGCLLECWARSEAPRRGELLPGGRWTEEAFRRGAEGQKDLTPLLTDRLPRWAGAEGTAVVQEMASGRPEHALRVFRAWAWEWRARQLRGNPLSLSVLVGYVWSAVVEAARLRQLAWALHVGLPAQEFS